MLSSFVLVELSEVGGMLSCLKKAVITKVEPQVRMMCCKGWGVMCVGLCCSEILVWPHRRGHCGVHYFHVCVCVMGLAHC